MNFTILFACTALMISACATSPNKQVEPEPSRVIATEDLEFHGPYRAAPEIFSHIPGLASLHSPYQCPQIKHGEYKAGQNQVPAWLAKENPFKLQISNSVYTGRLSFLSKYTEYFGLKLEMMGKVIPAGKYNEKDIGPPWEQMKQIASCIDGKIYGLVFDRNDQEIVRIVLSTLSESEFQIELFWEPNRQFPLPNSRGVVVDTDKHLDSLYERIHFKKPIPPPTSQIPPQQVRMVKADGSVIFRNATPRDVIRIERTLTWVSYPSRSGRYGRERLICFKDQREIPCGELKDGELACRFVANDREDEPTLAKGTILTPQNKGGDNQLSLAMAGALQRGPVEQISCGTVEYFKNRNPLSYGQQFSSREPFTLGRLQEVVGDFISIWKLQE